MADWTFITNHGAVLIIVNRQEMITTREIAIELNLTERSIIRIIKDLESEGYIKKLRIGRKNQYIINQGSMLRQAMLRNVAVNDLLKVLASTS